MGDIADAMINGDMDCMTGEWLGDGGGYPRTTEPGHPNSIRRTKKNKQIKLLRKYSGSRELNGVAKFLHMRGIRHDNEAIRIIRTYCKESLGFEGTLVECCELIQKDFSSFVTHIKQTV